MDDIQATEPSAATKQARRTYVIDRGFQLKYTLMLVFAGATISLLFGGMMYLAHLEAERALNPSPLLRSQWAHTDATLAWLMAAITFLMAVALGLFGVLVTHRVAGPIFVMSRYMTVLAAGRYPIMRPLRRQDDLKAFFERFQQAVDCLRGREAEEADRLAESITALSKIASTQEAKAALQVLQTLHDKKRDATDRIQTGS